MMRAMTLLAALLLAQGGGAATAAPATRQSVGTAMEELAPPTSDGEKLFDAHCAICHANGKLYSGTMQLRRDGRPQPVLARRTDLAADYVTQVARGGIGQMAGFTPVQLPNGDLATIAQWLARPR